MGRKKELTGVIFGKLFVIQESHKDSFGNYYWDCKCECGNQTKVVGYDLTRGKTQSCGCVNKIHQKSGTKIYWVWGSMKDRCTNQNNVAYNNYGGRGVKVCDRWLESFENFYEDMKFKYREGLTLERIDVNGDYEPGNCKWVTREDQNRNKRKMKNNTSGVTGIYKRYTEKSGWMFSASWVTMGGKRKTKTFSCNKYGEELAEILAIAVREKAIWELNKLGVQYAPNHGQ
jgi:hypothetical protein